MDGETMQRNLDDILKRGRKEPSRKDFDITKEAKGYLLERCPFTKLKPEYSMKQEATKFKAAMADPEFQAMLRDYIEEMQDPAQRAEQETYITELESRNRVPEGKEVVHPAPGFVIKTKLSRSSKKETEKLFVNVVSSDKLGKPFSKASDKRAGGESWSLPVAVGPSRLEKDKAGDCTITFDVCYHPETLVRARHLGAFRDIVALSSLERVEDKFFRDTKEKMLVAKDYRILKGVKYKSGGCAAMMVAKADIQSEPAAKDENVQPKKSKLPQDESGTENSAAKLGKERCTGLNAGDKNTGGNSTAAAAVSGGAKAAEAGERTSEAQGGSARDPLAGSASGKAKPDPLPREPDLPLGCKRGRGGAIYKLKESGSFEISNHTSDRVVRKPAPQKLIVEVTLPPTAEPTRKLDVIVTTRRLAIGVAGDADETPPRYLDLALPYDVEDESKCSAARDKTGLLRITMPVKPPVLEAPVRLAVAEVDDIEDAPHDGVQEMPKATTADAEPSDSVSTSPKTEQGKADHSRWVKEAEPSEAFDLPPPMPPPPIPASASAPASSEKAPEAPETPNLADASVEGGVPPPRPPRDSEEERTPVSPEVPASLERSALPEDSDGLAPVPADTSATAEDTIKAAVQADATFIECPTFRGKVEGYTFKLDNEDCGYHRDDRIVKVPSIRWHETVKSMSGLVEVENVVGSSVRCTFAGGKMLLSFDAKVTTEAGGERMERYRTELLLAGGVNIDKCSHDAADMNLVVKLAKDPVCEWHSKPVPIDSRARHDATAGLSGSSGAKNCAKEGAGTSLFEASAIEDVSTLAPGHGGVGRAGVVAASALEALAYDLD